MTVARGKSGRRKPSRLRRRKAAAAKGNDIVEDISPPERAGYLFVDPIEEGYKPAPDRAVITLNESATHDRATRRWIAYALIGVLFTLVAVGSAGWLWFGQDHERIQTFAILFSPVITLVGTVLGFYFSNPDRK